MVYIKAEHNNYVTVEDNRTVTIKPKDVTVTAVSKEKIYGEDEPELEADVKGTIGDDKVVYTLTRDEGESAGEYAITFKDPQTEQKNYNVSFIDGTLTIKQAAGMTVVAEDLEIVYDGEEHQVLATSNVTDATISYSLNEEDWLPDAPVFTDVKRNAEDNAVESYVVYIKAEHRNYEEVTDSYTVTIKPKDVTVTAVSKEKTYREADPELEAVVKGTIGDDEVDYTLVRKDGADVGEYAITFEDPQTAQGNYTVAFEDGTLTINPSPAMTVSAEELTIIYDGKAHQVPAESNVTEGTTISYSVDQENWSKDAPEFTDVKRDAEYGVFESYVVYIKAENKNYVTATGSYTVTIYPKTVTVAAVSAEKTYGDDDPELTATVEGVVEGESEDLIAYTLIREEGENVREGGYEISFAEPEVIQGNYAVVFENGTLTINRKPVTVTASAAKSFGAQDPANEDFDLHQEGMLESEAAYFEMLIDVDRNGIAREDGEAPGVYELYFVEETQIAEQGNYVVTFEVGEFTISTENMGWEVVLDSVNTHSGTVGYTIKVAEGAGIALIDNISDYISIAARADFVNVEGQPAATLPEGAGLSVAGTDDKTGTVAIPALNYSYSVDGSEYTWKSYLPKDAKIALTVTIDGKEDSGVESTAVSFDSDPVDTVSAEVRYSFTPGANMEMYAPDGDSDVLLDENAIAAVVINAGDDYVGDDDWFVLTVGGQNHYLQKADLAQLTLEELKTLSGAGEAEAWFGTNPTGKLTIDVNLLDEFNHSVGHGAQQVAFDVGAENSADTIANRAEETLVLNLKDSVGSVASINGTFGGSTPVVNKVNNGLVWDNVADWKQTPDTLPHSGGRIVVAYKDLVGHQVEHSISIVKSAAVTLNSLHVKPMTDDTVPSGKLVFYGDTNVWEQLVLTIGGRSFSVDALTGGAAYDNVARQWNYTVNLADIDFPVGVSTRVSIAYEDLTGGEAAFEIIYKDQAQTPVLSATPIVGSNSVWGFVEANSTVMVDVRHADGTVSPVPAVNVAVDQFGYFCVRLTEALAEGDVVVIGTTDFCGNTEQISIGVRETLEDGAFAEMLGANIVGELENGETAHRFATPVDLAELDAQETKSIELPILAYKGIEIGKVTLTLTENGKLELSYSISAMDYIPEDAQIRMITSASKPGIDELVNGAYEVMVARLAEADEGLLASIDVSGYRDESGAYSGVLWIAAEFDIDMDEANYINRGGRGVNFYRLLEEKLQTEEVLNTIYSETAAYEENMTYYELYQAFQVIATKY